MRVISGNGSRENPPRERQAAMAGYAIDASIPPNFHLELVRSPWMARPHWLLSPLSREDALPKME